ncbi:MAG TPA: CBS domain-containing protein [Rhodothermales bacterium]
MKVADIIRKKGTAVITIHEDAPLSAAIAIMHAHDLGSLVVLDRQERVVGLLTERDVVHALARHPHNVTTIRVRSVMNPHVSTCGLNDQVKQAAALMIRHRTAYLPVMEEGRLAGIVSMSDVVQRRMDEVEAETNVLREIILATH